MPAALIGRSDALIKTTMPPLHKPTCEFADSESSAGLKCRCADLPRNSMARLRCIMMASPTTEGPNFCLTLLTRREKFFFIGFGLYRLQGAFDTISEFCVPEFGRGQRGVFGYLVNVFVSPKPNAKGILSMPSTSQPPATGSRKAKSLRRAENMGLTSI
jgi:hypothetical protein